ncbi:hypothetical protein D3C72_1599530 [compost metagenome]
MVGHHGRYSGRGASVMHAETVAAEDAPSGVALVKRRLVSRRTFLKARIFEDHARRNQPRGGRFSRSVTITRSVS